MPYIQGQCRDSLAGRQGANNMEEENEKAVRAAFCARRWPALHRHKDKLIASKTNTAI